MIEPPFIGEGTITNPYLVGTAEELDAIRNFQSCYFRQIADIDLQGYTENWIPIGGYEGWKGSYDGNGFKILNLKSNYALAKDTGGKITGWAGLFGYVDMDSNNIPFAKLKNIHLVNVNVSGYNYIGALAGQTFQGSVEHCSVTGGIVEGAANSLSTGGLIGETLLTKVVKYCYADVPVTTEYTNGGGLIGYAFGTTVHDCFAKGNVDGYMFVGGLIGTVNLEQENYISRCYAEGNVSYSSYGAGLIGNLVESETLRFSHMFALNNTITNTSRGLWWDEVGKIYSPDFSTPFGDHLYGLDSMKFIRYDETEQPFPDPVKNGKNVSETAAAQQSTYEKASFDFEKIWYFDETSKRPKLQPYVFKPVVYSCENIFYPPLAKKMDYQT